MLVRVSWTVTVDEVRMGSLVEVTSVWLEQIKNLGFELLCYVTLVVELSST